MRITRFVVLGLLVAASASAVAMAVDKVQGGATQTNKERTAPTLPSRSKASFTRPRTATQSDRDRSALAHRGMRRARR